jgi:hypothetical protein
LNLVLMLLLLMKFLEIFLIHGVHRMTTAVMAQIPGIIHM